MRRRGVETMTRKAYPSDVTDTEWQIIEPLLPDAQDIDDLSSSEFTRDHQCHLLRSARGMLLAWFTP